MSRFQILNSELLRELRAQRGWTQKDLAKRAGYTDRLVRKAELGGTLDAETIRNLAEALSTPQETITPDSLIYDNLTIAKKFVEAYDCLGREMLPAIEPYITPDFKFYVAGDPQTAPFIGTWTGKEGYQQFLDLFFGIVSRVPGKLEPRYSVGTDCVVARYVDRLMVLGQPDAVLWTFLHFCFRDGLLYLVEDHYDTYAAAKTNIAPIPDGP